MKRWITYELFDPRSNAVRYVGKTGNERDRRSSHRSAGGSSYYGNWKRDLLSHGLAPVFRVVAEHPTEDAAYAAEIARIALRRAEGCDLVNTTDGGGPESAGPPVRKTAAELRAAQEAREVALRARHPGCFVGWKAIAEAIGISVETAQRWAAEGGMPVERLPGRVIVPEAALESWLKACSARPAASCG